MRRRDSHRATLNRNGIDVRKIVLDRVDGALKGRDLTVYKNRLTGRTETKGIRLYFEPESKRISERADDFRWTLGWEDCEEADYGFEAVPDDFVLPFDVVAEQEVMELPFDKAGTDGEQTG